MFEEQPDTRLGIERFEVGFIRDRLSHGPPRERLRHGNGGEGDARSAYRYRPDPLNQNGRSRRLLDELQDFHELVLVERGEFAPGLLVEAIELLFEPLVSLVTVEFVGWIP